MYTYVLPLHAQVTPHTSRPELSDKPWTCERAGLLPTMAAAAPPAREGPAGEGPARVRRLVRPVPTSVLDDPAATLRWEVEADGADGKGSEAGWIRYSPLQQLAIESAFADGTMDSVSVTVGRWEYTIRFDRGE
jgi:hypothetical protein